MSFRTIETEDVQNAVVLVLMNRLNMRTIQFDEEELLEATNKYQDEAGEVAVEYYLGDEGKTLMVKIC